MVDTYVSDAYAVRCEGSSPFLGTMKNQKDSLQNESFVYFVHIGLWDLNLLFLHVPTSTLAYICLHRIWIEG